jgi:hypothetical protein
MSDFGAWIQNYWSELGSLLALCGIFAAVVWYGRKILRTMRASQEQIGALLKLSVSEGVAERTPPARFEAPVEPAAALHSLTGIPDRISSQRAAFQPSIYEAPASTVASTAAIFEEAESVGIGTRVAAFFGAVIRWFRSPIRKTRRVVPRSRVMRWLQTPAGS